MRQGDGWRDREKPRFWHGFSNMANVTSADEVVIVCGEGCTVEREEPIFASLQRSYRSVTEEDMEFFSFTGTTDIRFFNLYRATPATCYGPVGAKLHAPDEWVDLESVKDVTRVLALITMDWCGVE